MDETSDEAEFRWPRGMRDWLHSANRAHGSEDLEIFFFWSTLRLMSHEKKSVYR